jgi:NADH-quinone oxidoreductase subunit L
MRPELIDRIQVMVALVPLFPLVGAVLNGLLGRRFPRPLVTVIGCGMPLLAFVAGAIAHTSLLRIYHPVDRCVAVTLIEWLRCDLAGAVLSVPLGLQIDPLASVMVLVVTGVGFLIHVYSIGYMAKDPGFRRYFALLNLFVFFMLLLVLADTLPFLFAGWEGVGLCSYLLIGFWHEDPAKADAGKKAFLVNRVGDLGFVLGLLGYFALFGTMGIAGEARAAVVRLLPDATPAATTAVALLFFLGAVGKSAQIPLHVWLPDAMAGPTPVSALIHAATMVTAGVYLVARLNFLYAFAETAGLVIATTGAMTALVAGLAAVAQRDIKKVLAWSTISQLGFMFLAAGLGAYDAAIFHLVTHAFFKALLFLGAGAVIHALHGEQDLFRMGGLSRPLRAVFIPVVAGALALAGIFPLSGFWSKDEILYAALEHGHPVLWGAGMVAAFATAFYSARLVGLVFVAPPAGAPDRRTEREIHRPGFAMVSVLAVLAILAFLGGILGHPLAEFLQPVWLNTPARPEAGLLETGMLVNLAAALLVALAGFALAGYLYTAGSGTLRWWGEGSPVGCRLRRWSAAGFGLDDLIERGLVRPVRTGAFMLWLAIDVILIDLGFVGVLAGLVRAAGGACRRLQTGILSHYATVLALGALIVLGYLLERLSGGGWAGVFGP